MLFSEKIRRFAGMCLSLSFVLYFTSQPAYSDEGQPTTNFGARQSQGQQAPPAATSSSYQPSRQVVASTAPTGSIIGYQPVSPAEIQAAVAGQAVFPPPLSQRGPNPGGYDYSTWMVGQGPYTLGRDDVINIQVRNQVEFSGSFAIGPDGAIQYNYIGDVNLLDMTKEEVEEKITELLRKYIRFPEVNIIIEAYNSKAIYIIGEVGRPGRYIMRGDTIKLRDVIVAAGLPTREAALGNVQIITPDVDEPKVRKVNLKKILYSGELKEDIDLYPGEVVVIRATFLARVGRIFGQVLGSAGQARSATTFY
jgi:protein involved in polysaccharide export with SLBB domain